MVVGSKSPICDCVDVTVGGSMSPPRGLSDAYYVGFRGCLEYVRINDRPLDLIADRISLDPAALTQFCNY